MKEINIKTIKEEGERNGMNFEEDYDKDRKMEEYLEGSRSKSDPIFIATENQYSPKGLMKIFSLLGKFILIFTIGGIGGVLIEHEIIPKLATKSPFDQYEFFKAIKDRTVIIDRTEEIKISDDTAMMEMIRKTNPAIVKITANYVFQEKPPATKKKTQPALKTKVETRNLSGVILTSDGMILTRDPRNFSAEATSKYNLTEISYNVSYGDKTFSVLGSPNITFYDSINKPAAGDLRGGIVLMKIAANNLPVIALGSSGESEMGEKVVSMGNNIFSGIISEIRRDAVPQSGNAMIEVLSIDNTLDQNYFGGGPLVNLKGELLGVNIIDNKDDVTNSFIAVDDFKGFINQVIGR